MIILKHPWIVLHRTGERWHEMNQGIKKKNLQQHTSAIFRVSFCTNIKETRSDNTPAGFFLFSLPTQLQSIEIETRHNHATFNRWANSLSSPKLMSGSLASSLLTRIRFKNKRCYSALCCRGIAFTIAVVDN